MRSRYSQITVFVLNAISDMFTNVTYTVIICIKSSTEGSLNVRVCYILFYSVPIVRATMTNRGWSDSRYTTV